MFVLRRSKIKVIVTRYNPHFERAVLRMKYTGSAFCVMIGLEFNLVNVIEILSGNENPIENGEENRQNEMGNERQNAISIWGFEIENGLESH